MTLKFSGINEAYYVLKDLIRDEGKYMNSRNGLVRALQKPVMIEIADPSKRILWDTARRANPFFHFVEAMWMLGGGADVATVARYNERMKYFSDDGVHLNGAYGYRWKHHFGYDQLQRAVDMLKANPDDRRVVVSMWDANGDLGSTSKDVPCNQQAMFRIVNGNLDMFTTNRSNDLIWGLCGANAVHLTVLQEYMAAAIGRPMGVWTHATNNLHMYDHHFHLMDNTTKCLPLIYSTYPLMFGPTNAERFMEDCVLLCNGGTSFQTEFFRKTMLPLMGAWAIYKAGSVAKAIDVSSDIQDKAIRAACLQWLGGVK